MSRPGLLMKQPQMCSQTTSVVLARWAWERVPRQGLPTGKANAGISSRVICYLRGKGLRQLVSEGSVLVSEM